MGYSTDDMFFGMLRDLWVNHKVLTILALSYILFGLAIRLKLNGFARNNRIDALDRNSLDVREALKKLRDWLAKGVTDGWAPLLISFFLMIIGLKTVQAGADPDPNLVQILSLMPAIVIAFSQLRAQLRGAQELRKLIE